MNLTIAVLRNPALVKSLDEVGWDLLIRQARSAELLAHLYTRLHKMALLDCIPEGPRNSLRSEQILANRQHQAARWEIAQIQRALEELGVPVILLKGAAYLQAELPPAPGRFFSDIDILVPRTVIRDVEASLQRWGWLTTHHDEYDQRYYRKWMHEIPPLQHIGRQSTIDVHHSILPLTARLHPDPEELIKSAVLITNADYELYTLSPTDMVLHSATHLFHDGELEHGLRDLVDLDQLLRHYGQEQEFWDALVDRSIAMELSRPLHYALRYTAEILQTPIPERIVQSRKPDQPAVPIQFMMDGLFRRALLPAHPSSEDWLTGTARWALYIRSHYLRMPLYLLIPHLIHKSVIKPYREWKESRQITAESAKRTVEEETEIDIFK